MTRFFKPKFVIPLVTLVLLAGTIVGSLAGNLFRAHAQPPAPITLAKEATPTVAAGGTITYTLTLKNIQPAGSIPLHDIHLTDTPPSPPIDSISAPSVTITPTGGASVDCSQSTTSSLACFVDDFAPGATVTVTFTATVSSSASGTIHNMATAQSLTIPPIIAAADTTITVAQADISIQKTVSDLQIEPGGTLAYTLLITNNGPGVGFGEVVTDPLPPQLLSASITKPVISVENVGSASCTVSKASGRSTLTCTLNDIAVNGTAAITFGVKVDPHANPGQEIDNVAKVHSDITPDPTTLDNTGAAFTDIVKEEEPLQQLRSAIDDCILPYIPHVGQLASFFDLIRKGKFKEALESLEPFPNEETQKACSAFVRGLAGQHP